MKPIISFEELKALMKEHFDGENPHFEELCDNDEELAQATLKGTLEMDSLDLVELLLAIEHKYNYSYGEAIEEKVGYSTTVTEFLNLLNE